MSAFCTDTGVAINTLEISRFDETVAKTVIARMGCAPPEADKRAPPLPARIDVPWHDEVHKAEHKASSSSRSANVNRSPASSSRPGSLHGGDAWISSSHGGSLRGGDAWQSSSRPGSLHGGHAWVSSPRSGSLREGVAWPSLRSSSMHAGDAWPQRHSGWSPPRLTDRGSAAAQSRFQDVLRNANLTNPL